ncbi:MAG: serine hydrolase [Acidobacteria bacterium]|nr:serine hydrolase [Acidobacteriota bacterium]
MKINVIILAIASLLSSGCRASAQTTGPVSEADRFKLAAKYSTAQRGAAVLVMKGDKTVFEDYENGNTADMPMPLYSGTKSFSGVMCAAAIEDKIISGWDEKVADTITEWKTDPRKSQITIRQLLSLTSGLDAGQIGFPPNYADAITRPVNFEPGTHFEYGPVPFQTFGELMKRKLAKQNETVMVYLKRRILNPLGINVGDWRTEGGDALLPQGASLTAREWVKFGLFLKNGGKWNGKQLIAKKLLDELTIGSKANPAYGVTFWLNQKGGVGPTGQAAGGNFGNIADEGIANGIPDMYMAAGALNQRLYIIPSLDMVIVRQGRLARWDDREFLSELLLGVSVKG